MAEHARGRAPHLLDAGRMRTIVETGDVQRAGDPQPFGERRQGRARLLHQDRDARIARPRREIDVVALAAGDRDRDAQTARELRRPDAGSEHHGLRPQAARTRLDGRQGADLDAGLDVGARLRGCLPEGAHVAQRVDVPFVGKEDGAGDRPAERRLECACVREGQHV